MASSFIAFKEMPYKQHVYIHVATNVQLISLHPTHCHRKCDKLLETILLIQDSHKCCKLSSGALSQWFIVFFTYVLTCVNKIHFLMVLQEHLLLNKQNGFFDENAHDHHSSTPATLWHKAKALLYPLICLQLNSIKPLMQNSTCMKLQHFVSRLVITVTIHCGLSFFIIIIMHAFRYTYLHFQQEVVVA